MFVSSVRRGQLIGLTAAVFLWMCTPAWAVLIGAAQTTTQPTRRLISIDTTTGVGTTIGGFDDFGSGIYAALTYDSVNDIVYAIQSSGLDRLMTIDPVTGEDTTLFNLGTVNGRDPEILGLAFDPVTSTIYGISTVVDELVSIDPSTGVVTIIGDITPGNVLGNVVVEAIAFDSAAGVLYGLSQGINGTLLTLDTTTGAASIVGGFDAVGYGDIRGLAYDPVSDALYGAAGGGGPGTLIELDRTTGAGTPIGTGIGFNNVRGLTYVGVTPSDDDPPSPAVVPEPATAGLTAAGALALLLRRKQRAA